MKYRIKPFDVVNDIWVIERRLFFFLWISVGVGSKEKCEATLSKIKKEEV